MSNEIEHWIQARKRPSHIACLVRLLFEEGWRFGEALFAIRRCFTLEALHASKTKDQAAKKLNIHPNTITRHCKEFGFSDKVIEEIRNCD